MTYNVYRLRNKQNGRCLIGWTTQSTEHKDIWHISFFRDWKPNPYGVERAKSFAREVGWNNVEVEIIASTEDWKEASKIHFNSVLREGYYNTTFPKCAPDPLIPPDTYCVYAHINKINNMRYIGSTMQPESRWRPGCYKNNELFYEAIEEYGWENFAHVIIDVFETKQEALEAEDYWMRYFDTVENGYNSKYNFKEAKITYKDTLVPSDKIIYSCYL